MSTTEYHSISENTTLLVEKKPPALLDNVLQATDVFALTSYDWKLNNQRIPQYLKKSPRGTLLEKGVSLRQGLLSTYAGIHHSGEKLVQILDFVDEHNQQREENNQLEVITIGPSHREITHALRKRKQWFNTVGKQWWEHKNPQEALNYFIGSTSAEYLHQQQIPPSKRILVLTDHHAEQGFLERYQQLTTNKNT